MQRCRARVARQYKVHMKKLKFATKYFLVFVIVVSFCHIVSYAKSIDINGIKVTATTEVSKKILGIGSGTNENKFSDTEYEKEEKEAEDKYVKVDLTIKNDNPYEVANVTVEEIAPAGFRQLDSNKNEKIINIKLEARSEKKIEYNYRYHQTFLKDQNNSILYDEDGNIIDTNKNLDNENNSSNKNFIDENKKSKINNNEGSGSIDEEAEDLRKGTFEILKFIIAFIICIVLLFAFIMLYKTIKSNDDNFFDDIDGFKCLAFFLLLSVLMNICFSKLTIAKNIYEPQIYEYGKSYEKVIYEPVYFNDGLYRFAYKISFSFDNTYVISDEDYENDTDGDGLVDALEYQYMTDRTNIDTDSDGLSDYIEVMLLDYNPLSDDTFNDGVRDGDRDFDNDKLTNIEEVSYMTDLTNIDTDYDTLSDYDEINVYNTNPLSVDTDEDLLSDPDELKLGLDPNNPRTDGVTLDSEKRIEQEYTITNVPEELREGDIFISGISGSVSGNIDNEVRITKKNEEVFNSMNSFVSNGFNVEMKADEKIDISLDIERVADRKTALTIVKFENGTIEVINTTCTDNTLNANIGSGTYVVMDSEIVLRDLSIFVNDYMP